MPASVGAYITSAFHQTLRDDVPAIPSHNNLHPERNPVVAEPSIPESLLSLEELDVRYDSDQAALWTFMRPRNRSSFTPTVLADFETWQSLIAQNFGPKHIPLRYLILGSRVPGVFSYCGDLDLFLTLIEAQDRDGLRAYGYRCVEILDRNRRCLDLPIVTVGLVQGKALGGGFEALLSFDFIIAERGSTFGLPEVAFGLFAGMGAHVYLSRYVGSALADRMIVFNASYSAETLYDLGVVHQLAEPGEGMTAAHAFMARSARRHAGLVNARKASRVSSPIEMAELYRIVDLWADTALQLGEPDLKLIRRLVNAQTQRT